MKNKILFDKEKHEYKTESGLVIPSVTQILKNTGLINYDFVDEETLKISSNFGTAVHLACEYHDKNNLDETTLDEAIKPYLEAWKKFRSDCAFVPTAIEEKVYSEDYKYAGTVDRIGTMAGKIRHTLIDIKTGANIPDWVGLQIAAYRYAYNEQFDSKNYKNAVSQNMCVQLKNDGSYKIHEYRNHCSLFNVFLSALNIYNWRKNEQ